MFKLAELIPTLENRILWKLPEGAILLKVVPETEHHELDNCIAPEKYDLAEGFFPTGRSEVGYWFCYAIPTEINPPSYTEA